MKREETIEHILLQWSAHQEWMCKAYDLGSKDSLREMATMAVVAMQSGGWVHEASEVRESANATLGLQQQNVMCQAKEPDRGWVCTLAAGHEVDLGSVETWHLDPTSGARWLEPDMRSTSSDQAWLESNPWENHPSECPECGVSPGNVHRENCHHRMPKPPKVCGAQHPLVPGMTCDTHHHPLTLHDHRDSVSGTSWDGREPMASQETDQQLGGPGGHYAEILSGTAVVLDKAGAKLRKLGSAYKGSPTRGVDQLVDACTSVAATLRDLLGKETPK